MRLVPIVVVCALLAGCSGGDDDGPADRSGAAAPPLLIADEERAFAPGTLAFGDVVACGADGLVARISVPAPRKRSFVTSTNAWTKDGFRASIRLDVRPSGRIVATCS
jgi:hypothetical protein